jgi:hypothetical protein
MQSPHLPALNHPACSGLPLECEVTTRLAPLHEPPSLLEAPGRMPRSPHIPCLEPPSLLSRLRGDAEVTIPHCEPPSLLRLPWENAKSPPYPTALNHLASVVGGCLKSPPHCLEPPMSRLRGRMQKSPRLTPALNHLACSRLRGRM